MSADDDRAVMERLAALEAELKADADAQRARKDAAVAKVKEQRASQQAASESLRMRQAELVTKKKRPGSSPAGGALRSGEPERDDLESLGDDGIGDTLALAKKAHGVKQELARPVKAGEKSWIKSGVASMVLGPIGWMYAGSMREAIPASAAWLAFAALASKLLPMFLLMPVLMVALPLSGIAGVVYAMQYNRKGSRQRLFGKKKPAKQLKA